MAKKVAFDTGSGPAVELWINDLVAMQFRSPDELKKFAEDILNMIPEIIEAQSSN